MIQLVWNEKSPPTTISSPVMSRTMYAGLAIRLSRRRTRSIVHVRRSRSSPAERIQKV